MIVFLRLIFFIYLILISIDKCTDSCPFILSFMEKDKRTKKVVVWGGGGEKNTLLETYVYFIFFTNSVFCPVHAAGAFF